MLFPVLVNSREDDVQAYVWSRGRGRVPQLGDLGLLDMWI
jgi:hypothetical protein